MSTTPSLRTDFSNDPVVIHSSTQDPRLLPSPQQTHLANKGSGRRSFSFLLCARALKEDITGTHTMGYPEHQRPHWWASNKLGNMEKIISLLLWNIKNQLNSACERHLSGWHFLILQILIFKNIKIFYKNRLVELKKASPRLIQRHTTTSFSFMSPQHDTSYHWLVLFHNNPRCVCPLCFPISLNKTFNNN